MRVAFVPRSAEIKLLFWRFVKYNFLLSKQTGGGLKRTRGKMIEYR
jgi:hypothetical protein